MARKYGPPVSKKGTPVLAPGTGKPGGKKPSKAEKRYGKK